MGDLFWDVATSYLALGVDGLVLIAAAVVGFFPLVKYLPVVGPYVPAARLVAVLVAGVMCFLIGFRVADQREEAKNLRITLAAKSADLDNAGKAAADERTRATSIENQASAQHETDAAYIASLEADAACRFDPFRRGSLGLLNGAARRGAGRAPASPGAR